MTQVSPSNMKSDPLSFGTPIGLTARTALVALAVFLISGFLLARCLEPNPLGMGTHRQLGLPPCTFITLFSLPCPGCGMTTSFAHFVRGNLFAAARANFAGLLLAMVSAMTIPWCLTSAAKGRLIFVDDPVPFASILLVSLGVIALIVWFWRLWSAF